MSNNAKPKPGTFLLRQICYVIIVSLLALQIVPLRASADGAPVTFVGHLDNSQNFTRPMTLADRTQAGYDLPYTDGFELHNTYNGTSYIRNYFYGKITPHATGSYTIKIDQVNFSSDVDDTFLIVYKGSFNPNLPLENILIANDDISDENLLSQITVNLDDGVDYYVVMTSFEEGVTGDATFSISGAGSIDVPGSLSAPDFTPSSGAVAFGTELQIESADADHIYYTTDGTDPGTSVGGSTLEYNDSSKPAINAAMTVKAIAVKSGSPDSAIASASYTQAVSADLTGLALSGTPSSYSFSGSTYSYSGVTVANGVSSITVTPTGAGTITVDGTTVASSSASSAISLTAGVEKTITVVATETGKSSKTYTVRVTRATAAQTTPQPATQPSTTGVEVLVNGKAENAGTATTTKVNDQTVITIAVDPKKLDDKLAAEGKGAIITIPLNLKSDVVVGELNGQMIRNMEQKQAVVEIKTADASYTLPAQQINISSVSDQLGSNVQLQDIKVRIEIAKPSADTVKIVENTASKGEFTLMVPPLEFTVKGTYENQTIEISKFNAYIERTIAIPDGIDPNKITTGIVIEPDGTVRHVPTKVVLIDGKYYAKVNSLTNSTYSVVWHPLEFKDVEQHWAKAAVNNMGSRMVISGIGDGMFNPDADITRAEFAAIIVRGLGLKLEPGTSAFKDVQGTEWYGPTVRTAFEYHLISGFQDGTFHPNDKITREEAMTIIAKAMKISGLHKESLSQQSSMISKFTDSGDVSGWSSSSITECLEAGIVSGRNGNRLAPKEFISRAEVAVLIQNLLQKSDLI